MIQDIKDEVLDTSLQPDNNPRYTIKDNNGRIINDNVQIDLKTPVIQAPTPLNRATLANIQGDLYTQDRYNITTVKESGETITKTDNIFPNDWISEGSSSTNFYTADGWSLSASSSRAGYSADEAIDGIIAGSNYWGSEEEANPWLMIKSPLPLKILKLELEGLYIGGTDGTAIIQGSKNGSDWIDLSTALSGSTGSQEVTLKNTDWYYYYKINMTSPDSDSVQLQEIKTVQYLTKIYTHELSIPLKTYEKGKIVNVEFSSYGGNILFENSYLNINKLGNKKINGTIFAGEKYNLIYNGSSWDFTKPYKVIKGTYTGTATSSTLVTQTIALGATPKAVIVYSNAYKYSMVAIKDGGSFGTNTSNTSTNSEGDLAYKSGYGNISIVEGGFEVYSNRYQGTNADGQTYYYIAIF